VLEWKEEKKKPHAYICSFFEIVFVPILFLSLVISLYFLSLFFLDLFFFSNLFYRVSATVEEVHLSPKLVAANYDQDPDRSIRIQSG